MKKKYEKLEEDDELKPEDSYDLECFKIMEIETEKISVVRGFLNYINFNNSVKNWGENRDEN